MFGRKKEPAAVPPPLPLPSAAAGTAGQAPPVRETLFGDMPLESRGGSDATDVPWTHFADAARHLKAGDARGAADALMAVLRLPGLESRHYLQAYHHFRALGVDPPEELAKELLGVVIEVPMERGLDLLAAYADGSSRYYNYSGAAVLMDAPDEAIRDATDALLSASREVVPRIGPWQGSRPPPPDGGQVRLNFLTPSGLHFGQGAYEDLMRDPLAGPVLQAATSLMTRLVQRAEPNHTRTSSGL